MTDLNDVAVEMLTPIAERVFEEAIRRYADRLTAAPKGWNVVEVAEMLGVSPKTIYKAIRNGQLWTIDLPTRTKVIPQTAIDHLCARPEHLAEVHQIDRTRREDVA